MADIYDAPPREYEDKETGVKRVAYYNVALGAYLLQKSDELVRDIGWFPLELQREFLRAFFDDEGCMDFRPLRNVRQIRGYQNEPKLLEAVRTLLARFGIHSRVIKPNEVVISGKENLQRFKEEINFSPGVCINGNRSNSIWKRSLEKRILLDRALNSFRV